MDILSNDYSYICQYGEMTIKILEDTPFEGVDTYASVGQFSETTNKEMLMLFYPNVDKFFYGAMLASVVDYFKEDLELNYYGGHTPALGPIVEGSNITAFYLAPTYAFEDEHISEHYFWILPITTKELEYLHEKGPDALEDHFEKNGVNLVNLLREDSF